MRRERQDRDRGPDQPGGLAQPGVLVPGEGRQRRATSCRSPGSTTRATGTAPKPHSAECVLHRLSAAAVALASAGAMRARAGHQEGNREVPADDRRLEPGRAVRAAGRGAVEEEAGAEERFARAMRPRPRRRRAEGRLCAPAALLQRRRPRDGPRDATAALHDRRCRAAAATRRPSACSATRTSPPRWNTCRRMSPAQSRGVQMAPGIAHPKEQRPIELGRKTVLLSRRRLGFLLRELPRRGGQAHPHAGAAGAHHAELRRGRWSRRGRPTASPTASSRRCNGASTTATGRCAMPEPNYASDLTVAIDAFLTVTGQGRALPRAGNEAMMRALCRAGVASCRGWPRARLCRADRRFRERDLDEVTRR